MSRNRRNKSGEVSKPSTPLVSALLEVAKIRDFAGQWRSVGDFAKIINGLFDPPRTARVTAMYVTHQISLDVSFKVQIDGHKDFNGTGIFRDYFRKTPFLYLCCPGEKPGKPEPMAKWHDNVVAELPMHWVLPKGVTLPKNRISLSMELRDHLQNNWSGV